jgi:mRNA interferase RelE/StbE
VVVSEETENSESTADKYAVDFSPSAEREAKKLHKTAGKDLAAEIFEEIEGLESDPFPSNSEQLTGEDSTFRLRVGDYRVVYVVDEVNRHIEITRIRHRKEVYKKKK